jgi:glycosyltransferase involved in cell wall biosynthesis
MTKDIQQLFQQRKQGRGNLISVVLPVYNEQECLPEVVRELTSYFSEHQANYRFEITFVDDRSTDGSFGLLKELSKNTPSNVKLSVLRLAKNSGSHIATTAGLNISRGDFTVIMASDGQDPASVIGDLIRHWEEGHDMVLAAREKNLDHGFVDKLFSDLAWKVMIWSTKVPMPDKGCDVLGMDRKVLEAFNRMDERNTTFVFRIFSLGFSKKEITYVKRDRIAGKSKWNFFRKISIMLDAITGYSSRPLKLITNFGLGIFIVLMLRWVWVIIRTYVFGVPPTDLTIILNTIFTSLGLVILLLGLIGDYIWRILDETRKRPLYEFSEVEGEIFDQK